MPTNILSWNSLCRPMTTEAPRWRRQQNRYNRNVISLWNVLFRTLYTFNYFSITSKGVRNWKWCYWFHGRCARWRKFMSCRKFMSALTEWLVWNLPITEWPVWIINFGTCPLGIQCYSMIFNKFTLSIRTRVQDNHTMNNSYELNTELMIKRVLIKTNPDR